jgi:hypothetical protein
MKRKSYITVGQYHERANNPLPGDDLMLVKQIWRGMDTDIELIKFHSRKALEEFNKRAGLRPLVYTIVPKNCVIYKHEREEAA